MDRDEIEALTETASNYGLKILPQQLNLFRIYLDELLDWNIHMNLTGLSSKGEMVSELFLDSLIPAPHIPARGRMLDVGSGAGFPALPLKIIIPDFNVTLLEADTKKVSFLRHIIRLLKLERIKVIRGRIEKEKDLLSRGGFPLITARALAGLGQTLTWCVPYLCHGGLFVSFLGPRIKEVLKENREIMQNQGVVVHRTIPYFLPGKDTQRNTVIFEKR